MNNPLETFGIWINDPKRGGSGTATVATEIIFRILVHSIKAQFPLCALLFNNIVVATGAVVIIHKFLNTNAVHKIVLGTEVVLEHPLSSFAGLRHPVRGHLAMDLVVQPRGSRDDVSDTGTVKRGRHLAAMPSQYRPQLLFVTRADVWVNECDGTTEES